MKSLKDQLLTESLHISNEGIHLLTVLLSMAINGKIKEDDILSEIEDLHPDHSNMVKNKFISGNKIKKSALEDLLYDLGDASY